MMKPECNRKYYFLKVKSPAFLSFPRFSEVFVMWNSIAGASAVLVCTILTNLCRDSEIFCLSVEIWTNLLLCSSLFCRHSGWYERSSEEILFSLFCKLWYLHKLPATQLTLAAGGGVQTTEKEKLLLRGIYKLSQNSGFFNQMSPRDSLNCFG